MPFKLSSGKSVPSSNSGAAAPAAASVVTTPTRTVTLFKEVPVKGDQGVPGIPKDPFDTAMSPVGLDYPGVSDAYARGDHSHPLACYSNADRPDPTLGLVIFNTDDKAPNFGDGTNWYDAVGNIT